MGVPAKRVRVPLSRSRAIEIARVTKLTLATPAARMPATITCATSTPESPISPEKMVPNSRSSMTGKAKVNPTASLSRKNSLVSNPALRRPRAQAPGSRGVAEIQLRGRAHAAAPIISR